MLWVRLKHPAVIFGGIFEMKDYFELVRRSIRKDFDAANFKRKQAPKGKPVRRVKELTELSGYASMRRFFIGKLVRIMDSAYSGGYMVEFVFERDRKAMNAAAGYSDDKRLYLLDCVKFNKAL